MPLFIFWEVVMVNVCSTLTKHVYKPTQFCGYCAITILKINKNGCFGRLISFFDIIPRQHALLFFEGVVKRGIVFKAAFCGNGFNGFGRTILGYLL